MILEHTNVELPHIVNLIEKKGRVKVGGEFFSYFLQPDGQIVMDNWR
jgi:hypothetical protein